MPRSRLFAFLSLFALTVVLAACGNEEESDPTPVPTEATIATEVATEISVSSPEATVDEMAASPAIADSGATPFASPVQAVASPAIDTATPVAATPKVAAPPVVAEASTPATEPAVITPVDASFVLNGAEQRDYMLTDEGCFGLGDWSQLKPGAQVIVRDASATVVDIATLEAGDSADECSWSAELSVTDSEYVSIAIPMVTEVWFDQADLESGTVEITLP